MGYSQPRFHEWRHWRSRGMTMYVFSRNGTVELIVKEGILESRNLRTRTWKSGKFPMKRMILNLATRMNWTYSKNSMTNVRFFCNEYVEDELKEVPLKFENAWHGCRYICRDIASRLCSQCIMDKTVWARLQDGVVMLLFINVVFLENEPLSCLEWLSEPRTTTEQQQIVKIEYLTSMFWTIIVIYINGKLT